MTATGNACPAEASGISAEADAVADPSDYDREAEEKAVLLEQDADEDDDDDDRDDDVVRPIVVHGGEQSALTHDGGSSTHSFNVDKYLVWLFTTAHNPEDPQYHLKREACNFAYFLVRSLYHFVGRVVQSSRYTPGTKQPGKWTKVLRQFYAMAAQLPEDTMNKYMELGWVYLKLSPTKCSHVGIKGSIHNATESPRIKPTWICFRAGWMTKAVHTSLDSMCGKSKQNDGLVGHQPSGCSIVEEKK